MCILVSFMPGYLVASSCCKCDYSTRSLTGTPGGNRRRNAMYEEEDDLTKDMDDPTPEPNIQEVAIPRVVNVKSHRDSDLQPTRGGTLMDIDEEAEVKQRFWLNSHLLWLNSHLFR